MAEIIIPTFFSNFLDNIRTEKEDGFLLTQWFRLPRYLRPSEVQFPMKEELTQRKSRNKGTTKWE